MKLKYFHFLFISIIALSFGSCNDDDLEPTGIKTKNDTDEKPDTITNFTIPTYADDYSSIASWANRNHWNLANVHDPTVTYDGDYYYMYGTDASYGNAHAGHGHFPYRRSKDLVNWEFRGLSMSKTPEWVKDTLNNMRSRQGLDPIENPAYGHWAPVVRKVGDKYRMYYSIIIDNYIESGARNTPGNFDGSWTERAFIGLRETTDLENNQWEDKGMVVHSSTDRGNDWSRNSRNDWSGYFKWNAIDPTYIVTPEGEHWLIYGSWHSGIVALEVEAETGKPDKLETLSDFGSLIARRENNSWNRWQAQEGPEIMYNEETGYYYLFLAYDELSVAYNTRVCRSENITGPYYGIDGANITRGANCWPLLTHPYKFNNHSGWVGFSHNCVFQKDDTGEWFYASQARLPANTNGNEHSNAIMMGHVRKMRWTENGWPVVMPERYAAVPQTKIQKDDLVGDWENIFLTYRYQNQSTSNELTLSEDGKASGAINGSWSYNEMDKELTIGKYQLQVERGLDWEADPREPTIVYSGLTSNGRSIWGKKVQ